MKSVRSSSIIWRDVWSRLLYYVTLIKLVRLFLKLTHSTTSMMKFSFNMMMKKYYIQLSFIARTCLLLNATTRYMIKNFWFKLIIKSSFELTFWTQIKIELSCSHFQLDSSWIVHIFNLMQLDSTENWVNSIWLIKNSSLMSRKLNIEIFLTFALSFCIIFLVESHEEKTWRLFDKKS